MHGVFLQKVYLVEENVYDYYKYKDAESEEKNAYIRIIALTHINTQINTHIHTNAYTLEGNGVPRGKLGLIIFHFLPQNKCSKTKSAPSFVMII